MAYVTNNMEVNLYQDRENGEIFQHFGHTEQFKIYDVEDRKIISSEVVNAGGSVHGHWQQASWTSAPMYGVIITITMGKVTLAVPTAAAITPMTEIGD